MKTDNEIKSLSDAVVKMTEDMRDYVSDIINAEVKIIGDYGTVLKSFELKAGQSARINLEKNTALKVSEGTCVLTAD